VYNWVPIFVKVIFSTCLTGEFEEISDEGLLAKLENIHTNSLKEVVHSLLVFWILILKGG
jgi:hypothetical protein